MFNFLEVCLNLHLKHLLRRELESQFLEVKNNKILFCLMQVQYLIKQKIQSLKSLRTAWNLEVDLEVSLTGNRGFTKVTNEMSQSCMMKSKHLKTIF